MIDKKANLLTFLVSHTLAVTDKTEVTAMMTANFQYIWMDHRITV